MNTHFFDVICDYICWILSFNGASRLLWISLFWLSLEFLTRLVARNNVKAQSSEDFSILKDGGSWWLVTFSSVLMSILILSILHFRWEPDLPDFLFPIGIILMTFGILLRLWAVICLGKFFTMKVMIFSNHHIIEEGPYRIIRHPSYLGAFLTCLGFGIASGYAMILISFFGILILALGYRIYVEEKALKEKFGDEWISYSGRTYRILPWIF